MPSFNLYRLSTFAFLLPIIFTSCLRTDSGCDLKPNTAVNQDQLSLDIEAIEAFLAENNIQAQAHESGVRYVINSPGDGDSSSLCNNVTVGYIGKRMSDGFVFDASDSDISFPLSRLITGWQIGIPLIEEGGNITLYIPSVYGYGSRGAGDDIPPNANLIFEISLTRVF